MKEVEKRVQIFFGGTSLETALVLLYFFTGKQPAVSHFGVRGWLSVLALILLLLAAATLAIYPKFGNRWIVHRLNPLFRPDQQFIWTAFSLIILGGLLVVGLLIISGSTQFNPMQIKILLLFVLWGNLLTLRGLLFTMDWGNYWIERITGMLEARFKSLTESVQQKNYSRLLNGLEIGVGITIGGVVFVLLMWFGASTSHWLVLILGLLGIVAYTALIYPRLKWLVFDCVESERHFSISPVWHGTGFLLGIGITSLAILQLLHIIQSDLHFLSISLGLVESIAFSCICLNFFIPGRFKNKQLLKIVFSFLILSTLVTFVVLFSLYFLKIQVIVSNEAYQLSNVPIELLLYGKYHYPVSAQNFDLPEFKDLFVYQAPLYSLVGAGLMKVFEVQ